MRFARPSASRRSVRHGNPPAPPPVPLITPFDLLGYLVVKAREFDVKVEVVDPEPGSNPADDSECGVLEDTADDPTGQELRAAFDLLNDEQRQEVLALVWLGRGDFTAGEWSDALAQAAEIHNARETDYLLGTPLLADYLEEGLTQLGYSLDEVWRLHL